MATTSSSIDDSNPSLTSNDSKCKKEEEVSEIQNFLGWAIKELIDETRMKAVREKLEGICYDDSSLTEKDECYQFAKSLQVLHEEAVKDKEYLRNYYPIFVASYNKGGICLVAKHIFPFGEKLLHKIRSYVTKEKLTQGDQRVIKEAHDKLLEDVDLYNFFLDCASKEYCHKGIQNIIKKTIWKKL